MLALSVVGKADRYALEAWSGDLQAAATQSQAPIVQLAV